MKKILFLSFILSFFSLNLFGQTQISELFNGQGTILSKALQAGDSIRITVNFTGSPRNQVNGTWTGNDVEIGNIVIFDCERYPISSIVSKSGTQFVVFVKNPDVNNVSFPDAGFQIAVMKELDVNGKKFVTIPNGVPSNMRACIEGHYTNQLAESINLSKEIYEYTGTTDVLPAVTAAQANATIAKNTVGQLSTWSPKTNLNVGTWSFQKNIENYGDSSTITLQKTGANIVKAQVKLNSLDSTYLKANSISATAIANNFIVAAKNKSFTRQSDGTFLIDDVFFGTGARQRLTPPVDALRVILGESNGTNAVSTMGDVKTYVLAGQATRLTPVTNKAALSVQVEKTVSPATTDSFMIKKLDGEIQVASVSDAIPANLVLNTIAELEAYEGKEVTIEVVDTIRGGTFTYFPTSLVADNGIVFTSAKGGFWKRVFQGYALVRWYGAKGDNTTDDFLTIQNAVNNNLLVDFGENYLSYLVSDSIVLKSDSKVKGFSTITQTGIQKPIFTMFAQKNITIQDLTLVGKGTDYIEQTSLRGLAILSNYTEDVTIDNVKIKNVAQGGASFLRSKRFKVINSTIKCITNVEPVTAGTTTSVLLDGYCDDFLIESNDMSGGSQGIIIGNFSGTGKITKNKIHNVIGQHGIYGDAALKDIQIFGNTIDSCRLIGIKIQNYDNAPFPSGNGGETRSVKVWGNTITNCGGQGVSVSKTFTTAANHKIVDLQIFGNTIKKTAEDGIVIRNCYGCLVHDNNIDSAGTYGLRVTESEKTISYSNNITNSNLSGILFSQNRDSKVASNKVHKAVMHGISSALNVNSVVSENTVDSLGQDGILSDQDKKVSFTENAVNFCGNGNSTTFEFGFHAIGGDSLTIVGNILKDSILDGVTLNNNGMRYGMLIDAANATNFIIKRNDSKGSWSGSDIRFITQPTSILEYADNNLKSPVNLPIQGKGSKVNTYFNLNNFATVGDFKVGDITYNTDATSQNLYWVCTAAGVNTAAVWEAKNFLTNATVNNSVKPIFALTTTTASNTYTITPHTGTFVGRQWAAENLFIQIEVGGNRTTQQYGSNANSGDYTATINAAANTVTITFNGAGLPSEAKILGFYR